MEQPPRLLHRKSQFGYTDRSEEALMQEPEAVSEAEQRQQTAAAHDRQLSRRVDDWKQARGKIQEQLNWLRDQPVGRELDSDVRVLQRQLDRIDKRLRIWA